MGWRFQKRIRIAPGITINLSKRGISTSIGVRGARVTRGNGKTRATLGLPGSGLSYTTVRGSKNRAREEAQLPPPQGPLLGRMTALIGKAVFLFLFFQIVYRCASN